MQIIICEKIKILKFLTFNFDNFNGVFIIETFNCLFVWHRSRFFVISKIIFYDEPCHEFD